MQKARLMVGKCVKCGAESVMDVVDQDDNIVTQYCAECWKQVCKEVDAIAEKYFGKPKDTVPCSNPDCSKEVDTDDCYRDEDGPWCDSCWEDKEK